MKTLLIFVLLLFSFNLFALVQGEEIDIYIKGEYWNSLTFEEFRDILKNDKLIELINEAEYYGKMKLEVLTSPVGKKPGSIYTSKAVLTWYSASDVAFRRRIFIMKIRVPEVKEKNSKLKIIYMKTAKWGFPITAGGCLLFFLLWCL